MFFLAINISQGFSFFLFHLCIFYEYTHVNHKPSLTSFYPYQVEHLSKINFYKLNFLCQYFQKLEIDGKH